MIPARGNLHRITDTLSLGPNRAFTADVMTSSLATLVNNLSSLAKSAVDAAVQPGADPAPKIIDSVSDMSAEELKRYVPGTVLQNEV